jgi:hypothetical protein
VDRAGGAVALGAGVMSPAAAHVGDKRISRSRSRIPRAAWQAQLRLAVRSAWCYALIHGREWSSDYSARAGHPPHEALASWATIPGL